MSELILKAAARCREWHAGQKRKYDGLPYHVHPARVAGRVGLLPGATEEMICAAYLHDVLEDTLVTEDVIEQEFGPVILMLVRGMTNPTKGMKAPRQVRKQIDRDHLANATKEIKRIKMLDRIDNLRDLKGAKTDFRAIYAKESLMLAEIVGDADADLKAELIKTAEDCAEAALDTPTE